MKSFFRPLCLLAMGSVLLFACNNENKDTSSTTDSTSKMAADSSAMHMDSSAAMNKPMPMVGHAMATLSGTFADTSVTGTVNFDTVANGQVKMVLEITVPKKANKSIAVHIHEHGDCGDTAKMAHGHWNPTNAQHGKWGVGSFHAGDIGNVKLDSKGKGKLTLQTSLWSLGGPADRNIIGRSIIVHGGMDDFKTQPSGNSGARIGCGVIQ